MADNVHLVLKGIQRKQDDDSTAISTQTHTRTMSSQNSEVKVPPKRKEFDEETMITRLQSKTIDKPQENKKRQTSTVHYD